MKQVHFDQDSWHTVSYRMSEMERGDSGAVITDACACLEAWGYEVKFVSVVPVPGKSSCIVHATGRRAVIAPERRMESE